MNIILFDNKKRNHLLPLTFTRPIASLRVGILTIAEKWAKYLSVDKVSFFTEPYLQPKYGYRIAEKNLLIDGSVCPNPNLINSILSLNTNECLVNDDALIAICLDEYGVEQFIENRLNKLTKQYFSHKVIRIQYPEDLFSFNDEELRNDFNLLTNGRTSANISSTNTILGDSFFAEEGAEAECSTFNTRTGPIYLGHHASVLEGSHIRGSFALCNHSQVKMGAKIYGATTIGPHSRVGGEITNSIIIGFSNKGHDGYLGNSVLGEWCNIGADSNNSNLKNNYAERATI